MRCITLLATHPQCERLRHEASNLPRVRAWSTSVLRCHAYKTTGRRCSRPALPGASSCFQSLEDENSLSRPTQLLLSRLAERDATRQALMSTVPHFQPHYQSYIRSTHHGGFDLGPSPDHVLLLVPVARTGITPPLPYSRLVQRLLRRLRGQRWDRVLSGFCGFAGFHCRFTLFLTFFRTGEQNCFVNQWVGSHLPGVTGRHKLSGKPRDVRSRRTTTPVAILEFGSARLSTDRRRA